MDHLMASPEELSRGGLPYADAATQAQAVCDRLDALMATDFLGSDQYAARMAPKIRPTVADAYRLAREHRDGLLAISGVIPQWARVMQSADDGAAAAFRGPGSATG
jgi:hypothetical protein